MDLLLQALQKLPEFRQLLDTAQRPAEPLRPPAWHRSTGPISSPGCTAWGTGPWW